MRFVYAGLGLFCVGLAALGAVIPLLPTVPFLLLAAVLFANSSPQLHNWIMQHKTFGPMIQDWQANGVIRPAAKKAATVSVAAVFTLSVVMGLAPHLLIIQGLTLACVMLFIWTRPSG